jgi:hypothetical protein
LMNDCLRGAEFPHRGIQECRTGGWNADHLEAFKGYFADEARYVDMWNRPDYENQPQRRLRLSFQNTMKS